MDFYVVVDNDGMEIIRFSNEQDAYAYVTNVDPDGVQGVRVLAGNY